jgi:integrase
MREGELLRLDWANVFMNAKRLTVAATDTRVLAPAGSGHYATRGVGTPKTRSGKRDVPIPSEAEHLRRRRYIAMGCPKKGLVFPSQANLMCRFPLAFY